MKIPITKTELIAMPEVALRKLDDFFHQKDIELTDVQYTLSLCHRYYYGMQGDGYLGFFLYFDDSEIEPLKKALNSLGMESFVNNLREALECRKQEYYMDVDTWFFENENILFNAITKYHNDNIDEIYEIVDENYSLRPPKDGFWVADIIFAITLVFGVIASLTNPNPEDRKLFLIITSSQLIFSIMVLVIYALRWKITVQRDLVTFRFLFRKKKAIFLDDISEAIICEKGIIVYINGRKVLKIKRGSRWYRMFFAQLDIADKIVEKQKESFTVRFSKTRIVNAFMWISIAVGFLVWVFTRNTVPATVYEKTFFIVLFLVAAFYLYHILYWKIEVSKKEISFRKALYSEMNCKFSDINRINIENEKIIITVDSDTSIKVEKASINYDELLKRFRTENIPFFSAGKRIRYEIIPIKKQLTVLNELGISPNHDDFVSWLKKEFEIVKVKMDPHETLRLLGSLKENGERISDDVFLLDTKCIEDNHSYATVLKNILKNTKGTVDISDILSNFEDNNHTLSFKFNEKEYCLDLNYYDRWFDLTVIARINKLLLDSGSSSFFYVGVPDEEQRVVILFTTGDKIDRLNELTDFPFSLNISESLETDSPYVGSDEPNDPTVIKQHKSNITGSVLPLVVFGVSFILMVLLGDELINKREAFSDYLSYAAFLVLTLMSSFLLFHVLRWKVTVFSGTVYIQKLFKKEKTYPLKSIVKVDIMDEGINVVFSDMKLRINRNCSNFDNLINLLIDNNITFYSKGELINTYNPENNKRNR